MKKVTIYRFSKNPRYENTYDNDSWYKVNEQLDDDDEFYLFREVWELDDLGYYQSMVNSDFVKVVSKKWLEDHSLYYEEYGKGFKSCRILNDDECATDGITEYTEETQNML